MSEEVNENELENVSGGAGMGVHPTSMDGGEGSEPLMPGDENSDLNRPDHGPDPDNDHHDHDADQQHGLENHGI